MILINMLVIERSTVYQLTMSLFMKFIDFIHYFFKTIIKDFLNCRMLFFKKSIKIELIRAFKNKNNSESSRFNNLTLVHFNKKIPKSLEKNNG